MRLKIIVEVPDSVVENIPRNRIEGHVRRAAEEAIYDFVRQKRVVPSGCRLGLHTPVKLTEREGFMTTEPKYFCQDCATELTEADWRQFWQDRGGVPCEESQS